MRQGPQAAAPSGEPNKPEGLSAIASQEWDALVEELQQLGTLSTVDRATIEMAARYAGYFAEAAEVDDIAFDVDLPAVEQAP